MKVRCLREGGHKTVNHAGRAVEIGGDLLNVTGVYCQERNCGISWREKDEFAKAVNSSCQVKYATCVFGAIKNR
jgi:hypothetical protein